MATTDELLASLQQDKANFVEKLNEKGVDANDSETFTSLVSKLDDIQSGGSNSYTGHADVEGLQQLGWSNDDIEFFQKYCVNWDEEYDEYYKVSDEEIAGTAGDSARYLRKDFSGKIYNYKGLIGVPYLNYSSNNDTTQLLSQCHALIALQNLNITNTNGNDCNRILASCTALRFIKNINFSSITSLYYAFANCYNLMEIHGLNVNNVWGFEYFAYDCYNLVKLSEIQMAGAKNISYMLSGCQNLIDVGGFKNLGQNFKEITTTNSSSGRLNLSQSTKLTHVSLMNIINKLYDLHLTYQGSILYTQSLQLGTTNKAKLTAEEIAIATNKGWTVS